jgi:hypothetical protein
MPPTYYSVLHSTRKVFKKLCRLTGATEKFLVWPRPCGAKLFAFTATRTVNPRTELPGRFTMNTGRRCTRLQHAMHLECDV